MYAPFSRHAGPRLDIQAPRRRDSPNPRRWARTQYYGNADMPRGIQVMGVEGWGEGYSRRKKLPATPW